MAEDRGKCLEAGCTDYATKPVEKERLLWLVQHFLSAPEAQTLPSSIRSNADPSGTMAQAIAGYISRLPIRVKALQEQLDSNNLGELRRTLHHLKGSGAGYGFPQITEFSAKAEESIREGSSVDHIAAQVRELIELISRVEGYRSESEQPCTITS